MSLSSKLEEDFVYQQYWPHIFSILKSVDSVAERRRTAISRLSLQESLAMFGFNMFQHVMHINH